MKIAIVHYTCAPVVGGVERVIAGHARLFERHGHEVTLACQRGGGGGNVVAIPQAGAMPQCLMDLCARQDVVMVHNIMTMPFDRSLTLALAGLPAKLPGVRFVAWTHDVALCNPDLQPVPAELARPFAGFDYVAVSELRRRQLSDALGVEARVVPNGIDPAAVLGLPANVARLAGEESLFKGDVVLLHPTRIVRRKNIECGLRVVAAMKAAGRNVKLLVTGAEDPHLPASGGYAAEIETLRAGLDVGREVVFVNSRFPVGDRELAGLYQVADALFLPSRSEGFGLPVLEAALHGLPVFCADIEPLRSIAPDKGLLFPLDEPAEATARRIAQFFAADRRTVARKNVLRDSTWDAVYANCIEPLLFPGSVAAR